MVEEPGIGASNVAIPRAPLSHPTRTPLPPDDRLPGLPGPSPATRVSPPVARTNRVARAIACCDILMSARGDVSGAKLAAEALAAYQSLAAPEIGAFFDRLAAGCSCDPADLRRSADEYCADPSPATLLRLQRAGATPRLELFGRLNLAPGGTAALVEMRGRLLRGLDEHPAWAAIEAELDRLLRSWFNHGFLVCRRIDAQTPPEILEKLVQYEAVHKIRDRRDLLRRLESDRRCYGLFHPALPDDPVIFTELSLTRAIGAKVQPLLDADAPVVDAASCTVALFYSISNCHEGLRGFSFGNSLIRLVVEELRRELPRLKSFATLSPIPGFRSWLARIADSGDGDRTPLGARRSADRARRSRLARGPRAKGPSRARARPALRPLPAARETGSRTGRSRGAVSPRQRRAARTDQLAGRHLRGRPAPLRRDDRELRLRPRRSRAKPRGLHDAGTGERFRADSRGWRGSIRVGIG